jgi:hypothetical protein
MRWILIAGLVVVGSGIMVTLITENGEVYNPIFRFVSRFIMGHTATLDAYLKSLTTALGENSLVTNTAAR